MRLPTILTVLSLAFGACVAHAATRTGARPAEPPPVQVMVVGVFHMSNPGRDLHNTRVDDVLAPRRQKEIAAVVANLARFRPTQVAVEWPAKTVDERYPKYLDGSLAPSRNEVVQLGFRLADKAGRIPVHGIDVDGDFPYEKVQAYAAAHGQQATLDSLGERTEARSRADEKLLAARGVSALLRRVNEPGRIANDQGFYRRMLLIGSGEDQPGAELDTAWYHRNFLICANLLQLAHPGDRIVVFYGYGHGFLLRQCVGETPGFKLVEPNAYLPR